MKVSVVSTFPQNSWLINLKDRSALIGNNVKKFENNEYYEGSWAHTVSPFSSSDTCLRFGSGFSFKRDNMVVFTPSHTLESIYTIRQGDDFYISNSLACIMSQFRDLIFDGHFKIKEIARPLWRLTEGIKQYPRRIYHNKHLEIHRYLFCKLEISHDFQVSEFTYSTPYYFQDFTSYRDFLVETIVQSAKNINAEEITSYLSKGYDSVACTALAKMAGGNLTLSVTTSRDGVVDSGSDIAEKLEMRSIEFARKPREMVERKFDWGSTNFEILSQDEEHHFEFFVGLNFEDEILYTDCNLKDHVVLTGFNGDVVWGINTPIRDDLQRAETSGSSIYEFRMRKGFVHIPIPLILNQISSNIRNISTSAEMESYIIEGTSYNRPIPRRIAEDLGVDRTQFGMKKTAASTMVDNLDQFRDGFFEKLMNRYVVNKLESEK